MRSLSLIIANAQQSARAIAKDIAVGVHRWHQDGGEYLPEHAAEYSLRALRPRRGNAYARRLALARRIIAR